MSSLIEKLITVAEGLDNLGLTKLAEQVDEISNNIMGLKQAQYVGVQGYWMSNTRCWHNCYRQKRASNPNKPAQEVWMSCWDEYKDSINNDSESWAKYASNEEDKNIIKTAQAKFPEIDQFVNNVSNKIAQGNDIPNAYLLSSEEEQNKGYDYFIKAATLLSKMSSSINDKKVASNIDDTVSDLIKEAQWWKKVRDFGSDLGKGLGGGVGGLAGGAAGNFLGGGLGAFRAGLREGWDQGKPPGSVGSQSFDVPPSPNTSASPSAPTSPPAAGNAPGVNNNQNIGGVIDPANVPSLMDSAFGNMQWTKPAAVKAVEWLKAKLKTNSPQNISSNVGSNDPLSSSMTGVNPMDSGLSGTNNTLSKMLNIPVPQDYEIFWDAIKHNPAAKMRLLQGKTPNPPGTSGPYQGQMYQPPMPKGFLHFVKQHKDKFRAA